LHHPEYVLGVEMPEGETMDQFKYGDESTTSAEIEKEETLTALRERHEREDAQLLAVGGTIMFGEIESRIQPSYSQWCTRNEVNEEEGESFASGECWKRLFVPESVDEVTKMHGPVRVGKLTRLIREYADNVSQRLFAVKKPGHDMFHVDYGGSMTAWQVAMHLARRDSRAYVGADEDDEAPFCTWRGPPPYPAHYDNMSDQLEGLAYAPWYGIEQIWTFLEEVKPLRYTYVAERGKAFSLLSKLVRVPALYALDRRFAYHGRYLCETRGNWDELFTNLRTALNYRATQDKNQERVTRGTSSSGGEKSEDNSEEGKNLLLYENALREMRADLASLKGCFSRYSFEAEFSLTWHEGGHGDDEGEFLPPEDNGDDGGGGGSSKTKGKSKYVSRKRVRPAANQGDMSEGN